MTKVATPYALYTVARGDTFEELIENVNELRHLGYEEVGGIAQVQETQSSASTLAQAMRITPILFEEVMREEALRLEEAAHLRVEAMEEEEALRLEGAAA